MKKSLIFLFLFIITMSFGQSFDWVTTDDFPSSQKICRDKVGNVYTAGFYGSLFPNCASRIRKYNSAGNLLWSKNLVTSDARLAVTPQNTILYTGADTNGYYLKKFDTSGVLLQSTLITVAKKKVHNSSIFSITSDAGGNVYLTGTYRDTLIIGNYTIISSTTGLRPFICKLNSLGTCLWLKGASAGEVYTRLCCYTDTLGNSYLGGEYAKNLVIGSYTLTSSNTINGFICKVNTSGTIQWLLSIGDNLGIEYVSALTGDMFGNLYATGFYNKPFSFAGTNLNTNGSDKPNIFLWKFNPLGQTTWCRQIGGPSSEYSESLSTYSTGIYMAGSFVENMTIGNTVLTSVAGPGLFEPFVARFNLNGDFEWAAKAGCTTGSTGYGMSLCNVGPELYLTGEFKGTADFGGNIQSLPNYSSYTAKIADQLLTGLRIINPNNEIKNLKVFPIPTDHTIKINFETEGKTNLVIKLLDNAGKIIYSESINNFVGIYDKDIPLDSNESGVYILEVKIEGGTKIQRIIKN